MFKGLRLVIRFLSVLFAGDLPAQGLGSIFEFRVSKRGLHNYPYYFGGS